MSTYNRTFQLFLKNAFALARDLKISKVLIHADRCPHKQAVNQFWKKEDLIWITSDTRKDTVQKTGRPRSIQIPQVILSSMNIVTIGIFSSVLNGQVKKNENILILSASENANRIDSLIVTQPQRYFHWLRRLDPRKVGQFYPHVLIKLIDIAMRFSREGREGNPIGTMFLLGSPKELAPYLRQLILNPLKGHPKRKRKVFRDSFFEVLRELSSIDGVFVVNEKGIVEYAGTYITVKSQRSKMPPGLGARHAAASAITSKTNSIAVVLSQSSGEVTVFKKGDIILKLEN